MSTSPAQGLGGVRGEVSIQLLPRIMFGYASTTWPEVNVAIVHLVIAKPPISTSYFIVTWSPTHLLEASRRESTATGKYIRPLGSLSNDACIFSQETPSRPIIVRPSFPTPTIIYSVYWYSRYLRYRGCIRFTTP